MLSMSMFLMYITLFRMAKASNSEQDPLATRPLYHSPGAMHKRRGCPYVRFPASTRKKPLGISNTNTMPSTMAMAAFTAAKPLLAARRICPVTR